MDLTTDYGPLNNKMQYDKVLSFIEDAKKDGGVIEAGGRAMDRKGYFIEPTIVSGLKEGARLVDDEQFGPVLPIIKFEDDDDAITRANSTVFGLGGSVWSADVAKANEMASRLQSGTVWVNEHLGNTNGAPFGGFKQSGLGRECGMILHYYRLCYLCRNRYLCNFIKRTSKTKFRQALLTLQFGLKHSQQN